MKLCGYIGSYASKESNFIIKFIFDEETKQFIETKKHCYNPDSKYLSLYQDQLVSIIRDETHQKSGIAWYQGDKLIQTCLTESCASCYVTQDEDFIYTTNYHEGTVLIYQKQPFQLKEKILIKPHAGSHQVLFHSNYLLVPCRILDEIKIYDCNQNNREMVSIKFPKGTGPRHGIWKDEHTCYILSEDSAQLFLLIVDNQKEFIIKKVWNLSENGIPASGAAICMSQDQRYLYLSLRICNQIIVFDTEAERIIQKIASGDHPRDMTLSPDMRFLFVANKDDGTIKVYERDKVTGLLKKCDSILYAKEAIAIVVKEK